MKIQLDDEYSEHYLEVEPSFYGLVLLGSVDKEESCVFNLTRAQAVELAVALISSFKPQLSLQELTDGMLVPYYAQIADLPVGLIPAFRGIE